MRGARRARARSERCVRRIRAFGPPFLLTDRWQRQKDSAVGEVRSADDVLNAVEERRARRLEQHLCVIRVELAHQEAAAAGEPAECVGDTSKLGSQNGPYRIPI